MIFQCIIQKPYTRNNKICAISFTEYPELVTNSSQKELLFDFTSKECWEMHFSHRPLYWIKLIYNVCLQGFFSSFRKGSDL